MQAFANIYNDIKSRAISVFYWRFKNESGNFKQTFKVPSAFVERSLFSNGRVAFAYDRVLGEWIVGGFTIVKENVLTHVPTRIRMIGRGGYFDEADFCILYDLQSRIPLYPIILEKCRRYAECQRTIDVNVHQQKTPRITVVPENQLLSVRNTYAQMDDYRDNIYGASDDFDAKIFDSVVAPAPAVFVQLNEYRHDLYNEMLNIIGVTSVTVDKKDRHTSDEVLYSVGGTYQSRFNRECARQDFIDDMKYKFGIELECLFYDDVSFNNNESEKKGSDDDVLVE